MAKDSPYAIFSPPSSLLDIYSLWLVLDEVYGPWNICFLSKRMNLILNTYKWNRKVSWAKGGKPGNLLKEYIDRFNNLPIMCLSPGAATGFHPRGGKDF